MYKKEKMKNCKNCNSNDWKFISIKNDIIAICKKCNSELTFVLQKKKRKQAESIIVENKDINIEFTKIYIDGGCSGNCQLDISKRKMISVVTDEDGNVLVEKFSDGGSSNIAELIALKEALNYCVQNKISDAIILTDSKNTISWATTRFTKRRNINDFNRTLEIQNDIFILKEKVYVNLEWVSRNVNKAGIYIENKHKL